VNLVFISHHFPPQGGAGVQRSLKFAKLLPRFGIRPIVITRLDAAKKRDRWIPTDDSMTDEIPAEVSVIQTDWPSERPTAVSAWVERATAQLSGTRCECIFATMSPFSDAKLASALAKRLDIPWIADLRDPWALDEFKIYRSRWHRKAEIKKMGNSLSSAAHIVMNTPEAALSVRQRFKHLRETPVSSITNGYDKDDFQAELNPKESPKFDIVHAGFLHTCAGLRQMRRRLEYALLGRAIHGMETLPRSHFYLLRAIECFLKKNANARDHIRIILAGSLSETDMRIVNDSNIFENVEMPGYLTHAQSVRHIREADLLFFPMHSLSPGHRARIVPGKAYEYMATGKPILAAVPEGDAKDFLSQCGTASICHPKDVESLAAAIAERYTAWRSGCRAPRPNWEFISRFDRANLTENLAGIIRSVTNLQG